MSGALKMSTSSQDDMSGIVAELQLDNTGQ